ncbi:MAG: hypothetical protein IH804_08515 [Planctomycetes bacterium]|nr:hypothetical protein [Planctomycetota bacterium]
MADVKTREFSAASAVSIKDPQIRQALLRVGTGFDAARREAIADVTPEVWEEWREHARQIKIHTLDHLDYYLDLFARSGFRVLLELTPALNEVLAPVAWSEADQEPRYAPYIHTGKPRNGWNQVPGHLFFER